MTSLISRQLTRPTAVLLYEKDLFNAFSDITQINNSNNPIKVRAENF